MLGAEQSGFIAEMGYETYQKILAEAVQELRDEEFSDIFAEQKSEKTKTYVSDCVFESDLELNFPSYYVSNVSERMNLYRKLDSISNHADLEVFKQELTDRFGEIPQQGLDLIQVLPLRWLAMRLGVERLSLKNGNLSLFLVSKKDSPFYASEEFGLILNYLSQNPKNCRLGETEGKRFVRLSPINSLSQALEIFEAILN
jgi:transcription-repair coupling factor (superfamily II helicase)